MKTTQDVRDFAAAQGIAEEEALQKGMEVKSIEFVKQGGRFITGRDASWSAHVLGLVH